MLDAVSRFFFGQVVPCHNTFEFIRFVCINENGKTVFFGKNGGSTAADDDAGTLLCQLFDNSAFRIVSHLALGIEGGADTGYIRIRVAA